MKPQLNNLFHEQDIVSSIWSLKTGKSPGPDGLTSEFFKFTCTEIAPYLRDIFNAIFNSGEFPASWGESIICPIHKKGSRKNPNYYRAVSLISVISKLFTLVLNKRLMEWSQENDIIDEAQAWFRAGYSTIDNLFTLQGIAQKYLTRTGGRFYCLFIDFSKACDRINHDVLWHSLRNKGIHGNFLRILQSMYGRLSAYVKLTTGTTSYFPCLVGTRQGCVSSLLLFSLFINDLSTLLRESCQTGIFITNQIPDILSLLYADDIASCAETVNKLQQQINIVDNFCQKTGMQINIEKTKIIVFRNGGPLCDNERWFYGGTEIESVSYYRYMGLLFTPKLKWTCAKLTLAAQAQKSIMSISNYQRKFGYFHHNDIFKLFDSMLKPILCYGGELWGFEYAQQIESIHAQFCKTLLGLPRHINNSMVLGECGRLSLCTTYYVKILVSHSANVAQ